MTIPVKKFIPVQAIKKQLLSSLSTYPFLLFFEEWGLEKKDVTNAWDNKGDIVIGNDVWIGYEAVILAGVTINIGAVQNGNIEQLKQVV